MSADEKLKQVREKITEKIEMHERWYDLCQSREMRGTLMTQIQTLRSLQLDVDIICRDSLASLRSVKQ